MVTLWRLTSAWRSIGGSAAVTASADAANHAHDKWRRFGVFVKRVRAGLLGIRRRELAAEDIHSRGAQAGFEAGKFCSRVKYPEKSRLRLTRFVNVTPVGIPRATA